MSGKASVLSWDWREQPDLDLLARLVRDLSGGQLHLHQVDTGSDQYAIVLATAELDGDAVAGLWRRVWHGEDMPEVVDL